MPSPLDNLEPRSLWKHFDDIRKIPRRSGQEAKIREHMRRFAEEHSFRYVQDVAGNVCIKVPATPGHEGAPTIVIQGHMDMVCEKNSDTVFDFENDPIDVVVDGDWVKANGTTLGADNGLGLAAGMAAATDVSVVHGPLELLCTVDEETGLTGAMELDGSMITGRTMLNLDSEDDGVLFVGCAGGRGVTYTLPFELRDAPSGKTQVITVKGLRGGHSGLDIGENRGNAIRILARTLESVRTQIGLSLARIDGGSAHNAIPREASAVCVVPNDKVETLKGLARAQHDAAMSEYGSIDPGLVIEVTAAESPATRVMKTDQADRLVDVLCAVPHGVLAMSRDIKGLVETSNNLATIKTQDGKVEIKLSSRSSVAAALDSTIGQLCAQGRLAGIGVEVGSGYPGWKPNMSSKVLGLARSVFSEIWGSEPKVTAIHAGLECGLIGEKLPGMDMISFGPQLKSVHSPDEKAQISSSARFWEAVKMMLAKMA
jgi:dipeptidase D